MSKRKINLEEILKYNLPSTSFKSDNWLNIFEKPVVKNWVIKAMKEACQQILELAAENAYCNHNFDAAHGCEYEVNKQSILNTINQIE